MALYKIQKKLGQIYYDTRFIDIIIKYKEAKAISEKEYIEVLVNSMHDISILKRYLIDNVDSFRNSLYEINKNEIAIELVVNKINAKIDEIKRVLEI